MKVLTNKITNEILVIGQKADIVSNGIDLGGTILGIAVNDGVFVEDLPNIIDVEVVPDEVIPHKYCYTVAHGFVLNQNYSIPESEQISALKRQVSLMQTALDELILGGAF